MEKYIELFRREFPHCVRAEESVRRIFVRSTLLEEREGEKLAGFVLVEENNILLIWVDAAFRRQGIGGRLLSRAEELIRAAGYTEMTVGAGKHYLMPGVPARTMPFPEKLAEPKLYDDLTDDAVRFFQSRGYFHHWDCNCFDMRASLKEPLPETKTPCRWAEPADLPAVTECVRAAWDEFTEYYQREALYLPGNDQRVLIAECEGKIAGALIVSFETEGEGLGSVGCTAVRPEFRGRHIGSDVVIEGTRCLREAGLGQAFLGYTYSGLDRLYGEAGYRICTYYFMGKKVL